MLIVMDTPVSGGRADGTPWPAVGEPFEVGDGEGADLVRGGLAHEAGDDDRDRWEANRPGTILEDTAEAPVHVVLPGLQGENPALVEASREDAEAMVDAAQAARDNAAAGQGLIPGPDGATAAGDPSTDPATSRSDQGGPGTAGYATSAGQDDGSADTAGTPGASATGQLPADTTDAGTSTSGAGSASGDGTADCPTPAASAAKADWVTFAVSKGADRADAEAMTKPELQDRYGQSA